MAVAPSYTVKGRYHGHEVRVYPETLWVTTSLQGVRHGRDKGFTRLFNYISGHNDRGEKIPMTAPVVWRVAAHLDSVSVSFYLGTPLADGGSTVCAWPPPQGVHPGITLERWPPMTVFVRRFGGMASPEDWLAHAKMLTKTLSEDDHYLATQYHCCYSSPFQLHNRRNEVWLVSR